MVRMFHNGVKHDYYESSKDIIACKSLIKMSENFSNVYLLLTEGLRKKNTAVQDQASLAKTERLELGDFLPCFQRSSCTVALKIRNSNSLLPDLNYHFHKHS